MVFVIGANIILFIHFSFILFVVLGSIIFFIYKKIIIFHIPAVIYGFYMELSNSICPLTYLENWFLKKANMQDYTNTFLQQYIVPIIYPNNLTPNIQIYLAFLLLLINLLIYGFIIKISK